MKRTAMWSMGVVALASVAALVHASGPIGVYARVEKVVLEPTAEAPTAIQIWGVFSLMDPRSSNEFLPPAKGYLYFTLPANADMARKEWADLKSIAGSGQIVAFGSGWTMKTHVRKADEKPAVPDVYSLNVGVTRVRPDTPFGPVRALIEYRP